MRDSHGRLVESMSMRTGRFTPAAIRDDFPIAQRRVYLNNASIHPMSTSTRRVVEAYFETRNRGTNDESASPDVPVDLPRVKALYAKLLGAQPSDIAFVPSTTVGENLVVAGLGMPRTNDQTHILPGDPSADTPLTWSMKS